MLEAKYYVHFIKQSMNLNSIEIQKHVVWLPSYTNL